MTSWCRWRTRVASAYCAKRFKSGYQQGAPMKTLDEIKQMLALLFGIVAITVFADVSPMTPWEIDTRTLDDYHYFLYSGGHYISLNFLMVGIGVLCVAFLVLRIRKKECGTWFMTLKTLLFRLLSALVLGLIGVLLLVIIISTGSTFGKKPLCYLDVPWNRAAYDRRCIECYESNGSVHCRLTGALLRPIEPRKNAPAEVQKARDQFIIRRQRPDTIECESGHEEAQRHQEYKRKRGL